MRVIFLLEAGVGSLLAMSGQTEAIATTPKDAPSSLSSSSWSDTSSSSASDSTSSPMSTSSSSFTSSSMYTSYPKYNGSVVYEHQLYSGLGFEATSLGGGFENSVLADFATVGGGYLNSAVKELTTIGGGVSNYAGGQGATIGGGWANSALAVLSSIGGGESNEIFSRYSTISGGEENVIGDGDYYSTILGGYGNYADNMAAFVGGGSYNVAKSNSATVAGGSNNMARKKFSTVGGGEFNTAKGERATVTGGKGNVAEGSFSTVSGGSYNMASGLYGVVSGGWYNQVPGYAATVSGGSWGFATGDFASVVGGLDNTASGDYSMAMGQSAIASHDYSAVLGFSEDQDCFSVGDYTVNICAGNGLYVNGLRVDEEEMGPTTMSPEEMEIASNVEYMTNKLSDVEEALVDVEIEELEEKIGTLSEIVSAMAMDAGLEFSKQRNICEGFWCRIKNKGTCEEASAALGHPTTAAKWQNDPELVRGCFVTSSDTLFFNRYKSEAELPKARGDWVVCQLCSAQ